MPSRKRLIAVFEEARRFLAAPGNDFAWSWWANGKEAVKEIDGWLDQLRAGTPPESLGMGTLFAPTGPLQEVSLSSGWGDDFLLLADRFDEAMASEDRAVETASPDSPVDCDCLRIPLGASGDAEHLGQDSRFAEVSVLTCPSCGRRWLRYFYEVEAFTGSGRWYLGVISPESLSTLTVEAARSVLESLDGYFYGGSYFGGKTSRGSGPIMLTP